MERRSALPRSAEGGRHRCAGVVSKIKKLSRGGSTPLTSLDKTKAAPVRERLFCRGEGFNAVIGPHSNNLIHERRMRLTPPSDAGSAGATAPVFSDLRWKEGAGPVRGYDTKAQLVGYLDIRLP